MKAKRIWALLVAVCMALTLISCSNQPSTSSTATPPASQTATPQTTTPATPNSQGITDTTITVGTWGPLTGPVAALGLLGKGMDAYFKYINDNGGINGRQIVLKMYDDGYQPDKTVAVAKKLVEEDKVFAIIGGVGTAGLSATKPYLVEKGIPMVSVASGSSIFTSPVIKSYFAAAANYHLEGNMLIQYAAKELKLQKFGVFYQNDDFGKDYLAGIKEYAAANGIQIAVEVSYNTTDIDYAPSAQKMKAANVDGILIAAMPKNAAAFAKEIRQIGMTVPFIANNSSGSDASVMKNLAGDAWEGTYVATFLPDTRADSPELKTFREYMKKYYPNEDESSTTCYSGWQEAEIFAEAVKRCGDTLTWDNLILELEKFDNWSGKYAQYISYSPTDHTGTKGAYIVQYKNGVNQKITDYSLTK